MTVIMTTRNPAGPTPPGLIAGAYDRRNDDQRGAKSSESGLDMKAQIDASVGARSLLDEVVKAEEALAQSSAFNRLQRRPFPA